MAVQVVHLNRDTLTLEYGADIQRLMPWSAVNAPFEGAWAVVKAGTSATLHSHHEHEIFIAVRGEAVVECDGEQALFRTGDVASMQPHQQHRVLNEGSEDFEFYSIWWDAEMAGRFLASTPTGARA